MKHLVIDVFVILALTCGVTLADTFVKKLTLGQLQQTDIPNRILGGTEAYISDVPSIVSLLYDDLLVCSGTVVGKYKKHILTSASCCIDRKANRFIVRGGSDSFKYDGEYQYVKRIIRHAKFDSKTFDYDIAILELKRPFTLKEIHSQKLSSSRDHLPKYGTVYGWGSINNSHKYPAKYLRKIELPLRSDKYCLESYRKGFYRSEINFCVDGSSKKNICYRDHGGPFIYNGKQYGIASYGGCKKPQSPIVFTNIQTMRYWIETVIEDFQRA